MSTKATTVETATETTTSKMAKKDDGKIINKILFIVFAEFLGYESPIVNWAEELCHGKDIPSFKKNILAIDAQAIYKKMLEKYTKEEIRSWWDRYYPIILEDCEGNVEKYAQDLPF